MAVVAVVVNIAKSRQDQQIPVILINFEQTIRIDICDLIFFDLDLFWLQSFLVIDHRTLNDHKVSPPYRLL